MHLRLYIVTTGKIGLHISYQTASARENHILLTFLVINTHKITFISWYNFFVWMAPPPMVPLK